MATYTHYFDNDVIGLVEGTVKDVTSSPDEVLNFDYVDGEDLYNFVRDYLQSHVHAEKEAVKQALRAIDPFDDMDIYDSFDKWHDLMVAFFKDGNAVSELAEHIGDVLYSCPFFVQDELDFMRENGNTFLKEDGFIGNNDRYLILGIGMGWRNRTDYTMVKLNSLEDMEMAITGRYDYTFYLTRDTDATWLTAKVYHHDAPTGETYYLIPFKAVKEAVNNEEIRHIMDHLHLSLKDVMDEMKGKE